MPALEIPEHLITAHLYLQEIENGDLDLGLQLNFSGSMGSSGGTMSSTGGSGGSRGSYHTKKSTRARPSIERLHVDLIGEQFWEEHPEILSVAPTKR